MRGRRGLDLRQSPPVRRSGRLARYPRGEATDLRLCADAGADLVWLPSVDDVYPAGFDTAVTVERLTVPLEGAARPGHFAGVTTVRRGAVRDRSARPRLLRREGRPAAPGDRADGPRPGHDRGGALPDRPGSPTGWPSRPERPPGPDDRAAAPVLHRALLAGLAAVGGRSARRHRHPDRVAAVLATERRAVVEYVSCADDVTLVELERIEGPAMLSLAARFGPPAHRQRAAGLTARNRDPFCGVPPAGDARRAAGDASKVTP